LYKRRQKSLRIDAMCKTCAVHLRLTFSQSSQSKVVYRTKGRSGEHPVRLLQKPDCYLHVPLCVVHKAQRPTTCSETLEVFLISHKVLKSAMMSSLLGASSQTVAVVIDAALQLFVPPCKFKPQMAKIYVSFAVCRFTPLIAS